MSATKAELINLINSLSESQAKKLYKVINVMVKELKNKEQISDDLIVEPLIYDELTAEDVRELQIAREEVNRRETINSKQLFKDLGI